MQRKIVSFFITDKEIFKKQLLRFSQKFSICCLLDSHDYIDSYSTYDFLFAANAIKIFSPNENILPQLSSFISSQNDWLFGHFSYDLKNEIESLSSYHSNKINFPEIFLFQPDILIKCNGNKLFIESYTKDPAAIFEEIITIEIDKTQKSNAAILVKPRISKQKYLHAIEKLKEHILRGDCYEINFCQEFFSENVTINPTDVYQKLSAISPAPFAAFYKLNDKYLLCASPERFLKKEKNKIISQPIKGTIKRNLDDECADKYLKQTLQNSPKDRSENVMIADLVRNDLSKVCIENSVHVEQLFGVYSFPQVHQMITTIKGILKDEIDLGEILCATFPMGSMTGAPKKSVMELIEKYEVVARGIFSGSVGYISPEKDFDFNVVIRSIMYNATAKYVSYEVGSGITFYSNAEDEYEECLLKGKALQNALL